MALLETEAVKTVDELLSVLQVRCNALSRMGRALLKSLHGLESSVSAFSSDDAVKFGEECLSQVAQLRQSLEECRDLLKTLTPASLNEEAYRSAFEAECGRLGLNLSGHFPHYEVFPLQVVFHLADGAVEIGGRLCKQLHPRSVAVAIQRELKALTRVPFNTAKFRGALIRAYDLLVAESGVGKSTPLQQVSLRDIYKVISVVAFKETYPVRQFSYDLYRLRQHAEPPDGRQLHFGEVRESSRAIPVPDPAGTRYFGYLEVRRI